MFLEDFVIFLVSHDLVKLPRWYLRQNLQEVFVMLVVVLFSSLEVPHSLLFNVILYPSVSYYQVYIHFIFSAQLIAK